MIELLVCSEVEIYLFGGCATSWKVASGKDLLFVRPDAVFNGQKPIRFCLICTRFMGLIFKILLVMF